MSEKDWEEISTAPCGYNVKTEDSGDGYEYRLLRRKKAQPLPKIRVGDTIYYEGKMRHVRVVQPSGYFQFWDGPEDLNGWNVSSFSRSPSAAVFRHGQCVWKKNDNN